MVYDPVYQAKYRELNREKRKQQGREYYAANRQRHKDYYEANKQTIIRKSNDAKRQRLYGLSPQDYQALQEAQNFCCKICNDPLLPNGKTHIDHCHTTNRVRGILCENCNRGLGMFKDDVTKLKFAIKYLEEANGP